MNSRIRTDNFARPPSGVNFAARVAEATVDVAELSFVVRRFSVLHDQGTSISA